MFVTAIVPNLKKKLISIKFRRNAGMSHVKVDVSF